MIGERLRLKRQANRMTLNSLAIYMENLGTPVTRATLSNYENGRAIPNETMLQNLAMALGTTTHFLTHDSAFDMDLAFFKQPPIPPSEMREIESYVTVQMEKRLTIDHVLHMHSSWEAPHQYNLKNADYTAVSQWAEEIRSSWGLNGYPIPSVSHILERQGWDIFELPSGFQIDGISGYERNSRVPFLYYKMVANVAHLRMHILQEAAFAYFKAESEQTIEHFAPVFAMSILLTKEQAIYEFGEHRNAISDQELTQVKLKYGIPKFQIMNRLQQLGIISHDLYQLYMSRIRQRGYPSVRDAISEPLFFNENPYSYRQKVYRAYSEQLITQHDLQNFQMGVDVYSFD